jgi:hypothetical protein
MLLVHFLREQLRLTGTHIGCDTSNCGACTVLIDGRSAKSCTVFAAGGRPVMTIEGLALVSDPLIGSESMASMRLLHAWNDCGGGDALNDNPNRPSAIRGHSVPPRTATSAYQRHPARRETELVRISVLPKFVVTRQRERIRLFKAAPPTLTTSCCRTAKTSAFKRSDVAHGRIVAIDTRAAEAIEGVEAVFTGAQIAEILGPMPIGTPSPSPEHRAIAVDTVRYAGEPVAVVVARDRYVARDAADAIVVTYDMLPAVVDPEIALTGKPAVLHAAFPNNIALQVPSGTGVSSPREVDDSAIEKAFATAEVVISQRMMNQRLAPSAMEPRGVVALRAGERR